MYRLDKAKYLVRILRRQPSELLRLAQVALVTFRFRHLKRCAGKGTIISPGTRIVNSANVRIGRGCLLQDCVYIRAGTDGSVRIGDRAALNSFCMLFGHGGIEIGEDTQIGPDALITTTDHDYEESLNTRFKPVKIGRRVWIGAKVIVLPGVTVGDGSVIGAGSVVTKDLPAGSVAVGTPARVIRKIEGQQSERTRLEVET